jgi:mycofactocin system glycosyltransferase
MTALIPVAPRPIDAPMAMGTLVTLDEQARFLDRDLITGGSPWRLLRLPGGSRLVAERWVAGAPVRAGEERFARTLVQQGLLHPVFHAALDVEQIDVIIPVYNDVPSLRGLLAQLAQMHVCVVDDGSADPDSLAECAGRFGVTLVRLEQNEGPAAARNAGLRATSRPLVWFLDVDVALDNADDVLARLAAAFEDPLLAAAAPRVRGGAGRSPRDRFEQRFSPLDMGARGGLVMPGGAVPYVPSACLVVRRSAVGGGFDETLLAGEDVDLVWRLYDQGWLVRYVADVVVTHRARDSWGRWWSQRVGYGASSGELAKRHGTRLAPLRCDAWTLVAWTTVLFAKPMIGARIVRVARHSLRARLEPSSDDADHVAREVVTKGMIRSGGPLARSTVRTFGPLLLVAALHPSLRRRALALYAVGTAWRWRRARVHANDVPLAVADDLAYALGVFKGAWRAKTLRSLTPDVTRPSVSVREMLGLKSPGDEV